MKKTYIKPVMESEMFVANEYVAACWDVVCNIFLCGYEDGKIYVQGPDEKTAIDKYIKEHGESLYLHHGQATLEDVADGHTNEDVTKYYHRGGIRYHTPHELSFVRSEKNAS